MPEKKETNEDLACEFDGWSASKIEKKTGIKERCISAADECASDLAVKAAEKLFKSGICSQDDIDYVLFCTESPDYVIPPTACIIQHRLGIPTSSAALDFNLGCSGFVYGLGLAKGVIESEQAANVLLITAGTYSKYICLQDRSVRTIFGDGAAVTLVSAVDKPNRCFIGPFVYGTDGAGFENLIVPAGGARLPKSSETELAKADQFGNTRTLEHLYMNGPEIFNFSIKTVPRAVEELLQKSSQRLDDIDLIVFHQANKYMLDHLRKKIRISESKFYVNLRHCGNTVSASIPIALKMALLEGKINKGDQIMLVGFGVGYSWGAALVKWR
ncbi:MAG: ketoacyl-ACP synthase III [Desulfobacula sp.]|nr:ketoacyl-ACP synthase III [Desulfobacula sp.]